MHGWEAFLQNNRPRRISLKRKRNFSRSDLTEEELSKEFRLKTSEVEYICSLLQDGMMGPLECRSFDLLLKQKIPICLKTLGSGNFQSCCKNFVNVSQPIVSLVFSDFTENMVRMAPSLIYVPSNSNEMFKTKREFYIVAGFTGVTGCICTGHTFPS